MTIAHIKLEMAFVAPGGLDIQADYTVGLIWPKAISVLKPVLWLTSVSLLGFTLARVYLRSERFRMPSWPTRPRWWLPPVAVLLLPYLLFLKVCHRHPCPTPGPVRYAAGRKPVTGAGGDASPSWPTICWWTGGPRMTVNSRRRQTWFPHEPQGLSARGSAEGHLG
jgi:hypothetical protein